MITKRGLLKRIDEQNTMILLLAEYLGFQFKDEDYIEEYYNVLKDMYKGKVSKRIKTRIILTKLNNNQNGNKKLHKTIRPSK
jgi:hypothetical protein